MIVRVRRRRSRTLYDVHIKSTYLNKYTARRVLELLYPDCPYGEVWLINPHLSKTGKIEQFGYRVSPRSSRRIYPPRKSGKRYPHVLSRLHNLECVVRQWDKE